MTEKESNTKERLEWWQRLLCFVGAVCSILVVIPLIASVRQIGYRITAAFEVIAATVIGVLAGLLLSVAISGSNEPIEKLQTWVCRVKLERRLRYLLGSAACGGVIYLLWLVEKWTRLPSQPLWTYLLGAVATIFACFAAVGGLFLLRIALRRQAT